MKLSLVGPSYQSRSLPFSCQRTINLYPERAEAEARDALVMFGTPGTVQWVDIGGSSGCRGALYMDGRIYAVIGTTLYSIIANGTYTSLGTIGGTDRLSMAGNGFDVCIVSRDAGSFIYSLSGGLVQITSAGFQPSQGVAFINQRFVHVKQSSQQYFWSALADGATYDALNVNSAEANPDLIVGNLADNGEVWLFGEFNAEVHSNTGDPANPFQRINGAILQKGIYSRDVCARMANTVFWLGNDGVVYAAQGYQPQRISTHAIETQLNESDKTGAYALTYSQEGHNFFVLTLPAADLTFVYDSTIGQWHERSSRINQQDGYWRPSHIVEAFGRLYVFDSFSGRVGYLDLDTYTEFGEPIISTRISMVYSANAKPVLMSCLQVIAETGVGLENGDDPMILMSYSDDGGRTYSNDREGSLGAIGQYRKRVKWNRLGRFYQRVVRLRISAPVRRAIISAEAEVEALRA
jgi:hypothetical protein